MKINFGTLAEFQAGKPGIYNNIPERIYHALRVASHSGAQKNHTSCPADVIDDWEDPLPKTDALKFGGLLHAYILEPEEYERNYKIFRGDLRSNAKKAEYAELVIEYGENYIAQEKHVLLCEQIREQLMDRTFARFLLEEAEGYTELTILWEFEDILVKSRLDRVITDPVITDPIGGVLVTDLKSTTDASEDGFAKSSAEFHYDTQAPTYREALAYHGIHAGQVGFIMVEKKPRFRSGYYTVPAETMADGWRTMQILLRKFDANLKAGVWPAHPEEFKEVDVRGWRKNEVRRLLESEEV